jgi:hypothetical protein
MASEKQKVVCFKLFMSVMMLFKACSSAGNIEVSQNKTLALNNTACLTSKRRAFAWTMERWKYIFSPDKRHDSSLYTSLSEAIEPLGASPFHFLLNLAQITILNLALFLSLEIYSADKILSLCHGKLPKVFSVVFTSLNWGRGNLASQGGRVAWGGGGEVTKFDLSMYI